jgi:hypothetical protein
MDLVAAAFRDLPERRLLMAGDGPDAARERAAAGANVELVGERRGGFAISCVERAFAPPWTRTLGILRRARLRDAGISYGRGGA